MPPVKKAKTSANLNNNFEKKAEEKVVSGQLQKKLERQQKRVRKQQHGVVFIKHLPHGFFEEQLKQYFRQFGKVTRLRLVRSKRTGGSKGFAFVEFEYPEVAQTVAETMDNYLMFKKIIKAAYIPPEKQLHNYFRTTVRKVTNKAGKEIFVSNKTASIQRKVKKFNKWSDEDFQKRNLSQLKKLKKLQRRYAELGIDFSQIVNEPKMISSQKEGKTKEEELDMSASSSSERKNKKKRKLPTKAASKTNRAENEVTKKAKKEIKLEDLLGKTIDEDPEDKDYIAMFSSDEEDSNSEMEEEEAEGYSSSNENNSFNANEGNDEPNEARKVDKSNETGKLPLKPKTTKVNRFDELIKRKPLTGGIQKLNKKTLKQPIVSKVYKTMQLQAAKGLAKPFPLLKNQPTKKLKKK